MLLSTLLISFNLFSMSEEPSSTSEETSYESSSYQISSNSEGTSYETSSTSESSEYTYPDQTVLLTFEPSKPVNPNCITIDQDNSGWISITPENIDPKIIRTRGLANCLAIAIWTLHNNGRQDVLMQHFPALWEKEKSGPDNQYSFLETITNFIEAQNEREDIDAIRIIRLLNKREIKDSPREIKLNNGIIETRTYLENGYDKTYDNVKHTIRDTITDLGINPQIIKLFDRFYKEHYCLDNDTLAKYPYDLSIYLDRDPNNSSFREKTSGFRLQRLLNPRLMAAKSELNEEYGSLFNANTPDQTPEEISETKARIQALQNQ